MITFRIALLNFWIISNILKAKFEETKERVAKQEKKSSGIKEGKPKDEKNTGGGVDLLAKLKPKAGSWNCETCYVNNPPDVRFFFVK